MDSEGVDTAGADFMQWLAGLVPSTTLDHLVKRKRDDAAIAYAMDGGPAETQAKEE